MTRGGRDASAIIGGDNAAAMRHDGPRHPGVVHHLGLEQRGGARRHRAALVAEVFGTAIVPELALRHGADTAEPRRSMCGQPIAPEDRARLTALALANDLAGCIAMVDSLVAGSHGFTAICLDALGHAAAELGRMWEEDRCSFVEVTASLGTLHIVLERLAATVLPDTPVRAPSRRILLASLPGEQHSFGLTILGDLFRQSGWDVTTAFALAPGDIAAMVRDRWFAIAGLSVADDERASLLTGAIQRIREMSLNRQIGIMVGGPALVQHPELAQHIGADLCARGGDEAVLRAEGLRLLLAHGTERQALLIGK
jgi:methanogenic corrinoid protein MtbC1